MKFTIKHCSHENKARGFIQNWGIENEYEITIPPVNCFRRLCVLLHELGHVYFQHHLYEDTTKYKIFRMELEAWSYVLKVLPNDCCYYILEIAIERLREYAKTCKLKRTSKQITRALKRITYPHVQMGLLDV